MDGPSDEDLMARISRGDERAFRLLARRYLHRAFGLARRVLGNEADAEEMQRVDRLSAFVQHEHVSGVYEVIETMEE